ncbi:MAG TPA: RNase adapter RapZ [Blastocatellia bacterium]|nr:RNase adapter RapZ [Blastocatellia bacterium]
MPIEIVIITGLSGSGMSTALNAFEDLGYFCVDNLPVKLIPTFIDLYSRAEHDSEVEKTALVIDVREGGFLADFPQIHDSLVKRGAKVTVIFLEADTNVLVRRFSETRRPHPLMESNLADAIQSERNLLAEIRAHADEIIDTTTHTVHTLRHYLTDKYRTEAKEMMVRVISFGYKHGVPPEVDLLLDVRFLPNPFFVAGLKELTGKDQEVIDYLNAQPEVGETMKQFVDLLKFLLPRYKREGKSYVTIGIGCTGGRHRSVMIAQELANKLNEAGYATKASHRDLSR